MLKCALSQIYACGWAETERIELQVRWKALENRKLENEQFDS